MDIKDILNEIYQQGLTLGLAAAFSMFTKVPLGTPMSLKSILTLAVLLGVSASLLKVIEKKYKIPTDPFNMMNDTKKQRNKNK